MYASKPLNKRPSPKPGFNQKLRQKKLSKTTYSFFDLVRQEKHFIALVIALLALGAWVAPHPQIAMWFGFALASYSAIANDSIQTLGTFIAANTRRPWWQLWLFIGVVFVLTIVYSWWMYEGDVSYKRLSAKGLSQAPTQFSFWQLCTPIILLILTRMRIPISTTFLLLNVFATETGAIVGMLQKSLYGYTVAFVVAAIVWWSLSIVGRRIWQDSGKTSAVWVALQWITSSMLWSIWVMQDAANIAVFLPRKLSVAALLGFVGSIFTGLGVLFYLRGDRMQHMVSEKADLTNTRAATAVNLVYMAVLFYFKNQSTLPMSTTWVFIGLLGGRELSISLSKRKATKRHKALKKCVKCIRKDLKHALIGLLVSIVLALLVNPTVREAFKALSQQL